MLAVPDIKKSMIIILPIHQKEPVLPFNSIFFTRPWTDAVELKVAICHQFPLSLTQSDVNLTSWAVAMPLASRDTKNPKKKGGIPKGTVK